MRFALSRGVHIRSKMIEHETTVNMVYPLVPRCLPRRLLEPLVCDTLRRLRPMDQVHSEWVHELLELLLQAPDIVVEMGAEAHRKALARGLDMVARLDAHRFGRPRFCDWFAGAPNIQRYLGSVPAG